MLTTELTESLRKHILWERQQKNVTANAALKRRHTSHDVKNLRQYPGEKAKDRLAPVRESSMNCSLSSDKNNGTVYDQGLQEYHETGW